MKPEAIPFWAVLVAAALGAAHVWQSYETYTFDAPDSRQFNEPQVRRDDWRFARVSASLDVTDLEPMQLVVFRTARTQGDAVARVVAIEGQRVRIEAGKVYVDGTPAPDEYAQRPLATDVYPESVVPEGCVFVLNDERQRGSDAYDSRSLGPIPFRAITHRFGVESPVRGGRSR